MKKTGKIIFLVGVILLFVAPIYQAVDELVKNIPGDGERVYGDNLVFKNILGIKTQCYFELDGQWEYSGTKIQSAPWMQKIGAEKFIYSNGGVYNNNSSPEQIILVYSLRSAIKIIPIIFIIFGYLLFKRKSKVVY